MLFVSLLIAAAGGVLTLNDASALPLPDTREFAKKYQGNYGSVKVGGCGFHNDIVYDPVVLLDSWTHNMPCFKKAMSEKARRGDTRVVIEPRADYHDGRDAGGRTVDLWDDLATFRRFIADIRTWRNTRGEPFEVLLFAVSDNHFPSFLQNGKEGMPDIDRETRAIAEIQRLGRAVSDIVAGTAVCWECRHQRNYMTAGTHERLGKAVATAFPQSWHGVHLIKDSSSPSLWTCDPEQRVDGVMKKDLPPNRGDYCDPSEAEGDDPNRGSESLHWTRCVREGWCDGFLFQVADGDTYLHPDKHPNYTGQPGALGRWWEVVVRLGNDPQSLRTQKGVGKRWAVTVDLILFEHIYDAYHGRSNAKYGDQFCRRALAIGGWGCGSASIRR